MISIAGRPGWRIARSQRASDHNQRTDPKTDLPRPHPIPLPAGLSLLLASTLAWAHPAAADEGVLDRFTQTLAERCLFENPEPYAAIDHLVDLPTFVERARGTTVETIFGEPSLYLVGNVVALPGVRLAFSFTVFLPVEEVRAAIAGLDGVVMDVPPWMDDPDGRGTVVLIEGDGLREPAFMAFIDLLPASEGDMSVTIGTVSFLKLWQIYL